MPYEATYDSIKQHVVPDWYHDDKFGIFVHWGLYSVPGWAPHGPDIGKQVAEGGWEAMFANNPYAEWYLNTLRVGDTLTRRHHVATYGDNFSYDDFAPMFNQAVEQWNPDDWASLFQQAGARYVVLTTKHHDGFLLWPSALTTPHKPGKYATQRDLVGELTAAVRAQHMRMGLYYSGGLDWSFNETPVRDFMLVYSTIVQSPEFIEYANAHWRELIDRYAPSLMWNDIGYPAAANLPELFAYYYNTIPEGVINDRFGQEPPKHTPGEMAGPPSAKHYDFTTPEYSSYNNTVEWKWEGTRGIGHSFGYNQNEGPDDYLTVEALVNMLADVVSKNGNLLLDVGPMADGTIPDLQRQRLLGLGAWLKTNGDAIFGTRPWTRAEGSTRDGVPVRFTRKGDTVYALLLGTPSGERVTIEDMPPATGVHLLGHDGALISQQEGDHLTITLPAHVPSSPAYAFKLTS
jgi:alpha-L-fucosidase